jgi:hypothetical protein
MPVHDWTRVPPGVFHDFHHVWIGELRNALNRSLLPAGYYALAEQHTGKRIADVLTLQEGFPATNGPSQDNSGGGVAVAEAPPQVRHKLSLQAALRVLRKTLAIRHVSGDRLVAVVEIVSPANKDRRTHVEEFLDKLETALRHGIHVVLVDLFPPGAADPQGLHGEFWDRLGGDVEPVTAKEPLRVVSYVADVPATAFVEPLAVGQALPSIPLFLTSDRYVRMPLETTYQTTWAGTPGKYRTLLEGEGN